ncbi:MAG: MBOAT family protein [Thermodesulfobacteriota bacterium]
MLFNSYTFIFGYLPVVIGIFFLVARCSHQLAAAWLAAASLFFYGWWSPRFVLLLLGSVGFNFAMGYAIARQRLRQPSSVQVKALLMVAVGGNVALLAYFKYVNFFIATANDLWRAGWTFADIILPLGISFYSFTQIAYLVDVYRGLAREYNPLHYLLFVTYFPHLIAGPILHHKQMMPQFGQREIYRPHAENLTVGLTIFAIGLFKKTVIADHFALYATPVFDLAAANGRLPLLEAWVGALAYTFQLYFDFSGYSDMAVGLSWMFNISLPLNFNSPYKATSIIEFWRRWHMTLSAFLRDYLYIPLGGNRQGKMRRYVNLLVTMVLGGLWHGANWTFVFWGGLHGIYLLLNHGWRVVYDKLRLPPLPGSTVVAGALTFVAVVIAWVPFRSASLGAAVNLLSGMFGFHGVVLPTRFASSLHMLQEFGVQFGGGSLALPWLDVVLWTAAGLAIVWLFPNTQQWMEGNFPGDGNRSATGVLGMACRFRPGLRHGFVVGVLLLFALVALDKPGEFLYFQF